MRIMTFLLFSVCSMADFGIKTGESVLLVWDQPSTPTNLKQLAEELYTIVGSDGKVSVENVERLLLCEWCFTYFGYHQGILRKICVFKYYLFPSASHLASTFCCVVSCVLADSSTVHSSETLAELARILKPGGKLILDEAVTGGSNLSVQGHSKLPTAGSKTLVFINVCFWGNRNCSSIFKGVLNGMPTSSGIL